MKKAISLILLVLLALFTIFPLLFLLIGSFMGNRELMEHFAPMLKQADGYVTWLLLPVYPTLRNFVELLFDSPEFFVMFWNSVKITGGILAGQLIFGMPAAWGLAIYEFRGRKLLYRLYIIMMMMPFQATMLSEYLVLDRLGMLDSMTAVIWPGIFSAFSVFIMYRFFGGISGSVLEAARLDGAGEIQIFFRLGIPLGSSGIMAAMVLSYLECWSMLEQPMTFLKTKSLWPLSMFLPEINSGNAGFCICVSFAVLLPAVFVFLIGQDYLEQGIATSMLKE